MIVLVPTGPRIMRLSWLKEYTAYIQLIREALRFTGKVDHDLRSISSGIKHVISFPLKSRCFIVKEDILPN